MDQYIDNRHKDILYELLANPADPGRLHKTTLERMVHDNPQSGLLQVLLARAGESDSIKAAAAYFEPGVLHKLLHNADNLTLIPPGRIFHPAGNGAQDHAITSPADEDVFDTDTKEEREQTTADKEAGIAIAETNTNISGEPGAIFVPHEPAETDVEAEPAKQPAESKEEEPVETSDEEVQDGPPDNGNIIPELYNSYEGQQAQPEAGQTTAMEEPAEEPGTAIPELYQSYGEQLNGQKEEDLPYENGEPTPSTAITAANGYRDEQVGQDIDDEIYEEIVGIDDIGFMPTVNVLHESEEPQADDVPAGEQAWQNTFSDEEDYPADEEEEDERPLQLSAGLTGQDIAIDQEKLILGNIVSADYLSFDKKLDELRSAEKGDQAYPATVVMEDFGPEPVREHEVISRYNDDTMPYSFMWWLDKTRKEHSDSFQPYAANPVPAGAGIAGETAEQPAQQRVKPVKRKAPDELQQQYYENIFSLTSVSGIERDEADKGIAFDHTKKEDIIIERFIHNEPQIRPPAADRLDNENKAKRSAEDEDALVTETLARIYTDQMLYHKAIATYKKLILKFPEKKLYFAARIEQLEKKTN